MGFKQTGGGFEDAENLGARMRAGLSEAGNMIGQALVKRAKDGILQPPKTGRKYASLPYQSSAPGEYSANQSGDLLKSIDYRMSGPSYLTFYATSDHAGYQEDGTATMEARRNLARAIDESDGLIINLLDQVIWRAIGGGR